jgi:hypothetical protein
MSSRELLKRAVTLIKCLNGASWEHEVPQVVIQDIETYLAQPEPEPVAYEYTSTCGNIFVKHTPPQYARNIRPLYTTPPDQSARIAELSQLEAEIINTLRELIKAQEYIKELAAEHSVLVVKNRDLEQQLAALQAKRKPLTSDQVREVYRTAFPKGPYIYTNDAFVFARMIEKAHGIGEII